MNSTKEEQKYWTERYESGATGWNIGEVSSPIKAYLDQIEDRSLSILIPGAGNAYEAEYAYRLGFKSTYVLDIARAPLDNLKQRLPDFPSPQLLEANFFEHLGQYDLIIEQTFFCSFLPTPENRKAYAQKMYDLLKPKGKLVGLWFNLPLGTKRPFGGTKEEYLSYFEPLFEVKTFEICYNSIPPRAGNEFFGVLEHV